MNFLTVMNSGIVSYYCGANERSISALRKLGDFNGLVEKPHTELVNVKYLLTDLVKVKF